MGFLYGVVCESQGYSNVVHLSGFLKSPEGSGVHEYMFAIGSVAITHMIIEKVYIEGFFEGRRVDGIPGDTHGS